MGEQNRENCRAINVFFPILIVAYVGMSLLFAIVVQKNHIVMPLWAQYVVSQAFVLIPALLYVLIFREHFPKEISYKPLKPLDVLLSLLTGYALIPMVLFLAQITMLFATNYLNSSTSELTQYPFLVQILVVAVIPPIVEEFVFRGLFFHTYRKMGIFTGAIVSGVIFGLFHLNINQFCYAMVMGFVFAYMVEATGSMWSSMLAHFAVNTYSITMLALSKHLLGFAEQMQSQAETSNEVLNSVSALDSASAMDSAQAFASSPAVIVIQLLVLAGFAGGFMMLAVMMIRKMAKRNGRLEHMQIFKKENVQSELPHGRIRDVITWPAIATAVFCVVYMIFIELA